MMANPDPSPITRFQPGQSGNPGGKAAGARNRISGRFLNDLADDYELHGAAVIARVREESPVTYIKVVASLLPTKIETSHPLSGVSDAELDASIEFIRRQCAAGLSDAEMEAAITIFRGQRAAEEGGPTGEGEHD